MQFCIILYPANVVLKVPTRAATDMICISYNFKYLRLDIISPNCVSVISGTNVSEKSSSTCG